MGSDSVIPFALKSCPNFGMRIFVMLVQVCHVV